MVDWILARRIARAVSGFQPGEGTEGEAPAVDGSVLVEFTKQSEKSIRSYTGLKPKVAPVPIAKPVDRDGWIDANLESLKNILDPATEKLTGTAGKPVGLLAASLLTVEVGVLSGFLSQRVLGQYDFPVLDPTAPAQLLYVTPNLALSAEKLSAPPLELMHWVALHETTHAMQFGSVPWLRPHVNSMIKQVLGSVQVQSKPRVPNMADIQGLIQAVRERELATFFLGKERQELVMQMQAFMAVIEGYAEHVMDVVGAKEIPAMARMRIGMDKRRQQRTGLLRIIERLLGLEMKMRQYEQGKKFCDAVASEGGIKALNKVWKGPEAMPTQSELDSPELWLKRMR